MSADREAARIRVTPVLLSAVVLAGCDVAYVAVNWRGEVLPRATGWIPLSLITLLAVYACRETARAPGMARVTGRVWRTLSRVAMLIAVTVVSAGYDALHGSPASATGDMSPVTAGLFILAMLYLLTSLLRLPGDALDDRERLLRFWLDAAAVVASVGLLVWYAAFRHAGARESSTPSVLVVLMLLIGALAFVKVAFTGFGAVDRTSVRLLALAAAFSAVGGGLTQMFAPGRVQLNNPLLSVPVAMILVVFAADRQRRAAGVPRQLGNRRSCSVLPYLAVATTDALLLWGAIQTDTTTLIVAVTAVTLTALVVLRQMSALRENTALLTEVDATVVDLNRAQAELAHRANHDDLTNLPNRVLFEQESRRLVPEAGRDGLSVALIDLDDFKAINDRLGHSVGDAVLVAVAQRLRECVRRHDIVARLGGDEFGLLLPGLRGSDAAAALDRVHAALSRPVRADGHDLLVKASIGLAEAWPGSRPQELLRRADLAMYAAKERGKARYAVYDAELEQHQAADAQLGAELRQAVDRDEFFLVYQPIVELPSGTWTSVETLVRWRHPERGLVPPDAFISIAERNGLIVPIGEWILRTACRQAAQWHEELGDAAPQRVGVNVSARQLREPGFALTVVEALQEAGLAPERLTVEVTETAVFEKGMALDTLHALADLGVGVALDDFGTGHSSLGLLRTCPVHSLKLDKSFVDGITGATEEAVIASAIIRITNGLHMYAVAEGVETAEQAEVLHRLGYRYAQGYHFARPLTPAQYTERLTATVAPRVSTAA